ncbi:Uncharacterized protein SCF082_LOCUS15276 [Durusdinium trenchii]|uniref:Phosphatidate phosphatase APP1 catalytic domain-containing protein n=1 Tax=Durusdinium trenchii TaxID=1381693 RepID=A0ABP0K3C2_9DINO
MAGILAVLLVHVLTENLNFAVWHRPTVQLAFFFVLLNAFVAVAFLSPDSPVLYFVTINKTPLSLALVFGLAVPIWSFTVVQAVLVDVTQFQGHKETERLSPLKRQLSTGRDGIESPRSSARLSNRSRSSTVMQTTVVNESEFITRSKSEFVNRQLELLDRFALSTPVRRFAAWMRGSMLENQQKIVSILDTTTQEELNHIIETSNVPKMFRYGERLVRLVMDRHEDLSTVSKATVVHAMQRVGTLKFFTNEQRLIVSLFTGTKGTELTLLKNLTDSSGDFNNLFKLVFTDISSKGLQRKILEHIEREGQAAKEVNDDRGYFPIKICSDVDDTLYASGGNFPAGADKRFPRHCVYPGVLQLYEEIDMHARAAGRASETADADSESEDQTVADVRSSSKVKVSVLAPWKQGGRVFELDCKVKSTIRELQDTVEERYHIPQRQQELVLTSKKQKRERAPDEDWKDGNLVFVSARPHVFKDVAENASYRRFHHLVNQGLMHATPTMLSGSLYSGTMAVSFRIFELIKLFLLDLLDATSAAFSAFVSKERERWKRRRKNRRSRKKRGSQSPLPAEMMEEDIDEASRSDSGVLQRSPSSFGSRQTTNRNWEAVGRNKVFSMTQYLSLYPEYKLVFFGDNGQGDLLAAELLATQPESCDNVRASFIHDVLSPETAGMMLSSFDEDQREALWEKHNIVFFKTYVEAGRRAFELGLISLSGLHRVGLAAHDDIMDLFVKYPSRDWSLVLEETKQDIRRANKTLRAAGGTMQIPSPIPPFQIPTL